MKTNNNKQNKFRLLYNIFYSTSENVNNISQIDENEHKII